MKSLIGHSNVQQFFSKVQDAGALHHAYCFVGREHVGKRTFAMQLAAELLGLESLAKLEAHPDWLYISQQKNKKTGKTKKNIDVEQIRILKEHVSRHAAMGGYTIALIDGAEKMSQSASNALLKTLEEPGKQTIIFVITTNEELLLETIRSRCQTIYFSPVPEESIVEGLIARGASKKDAERIAAQSYGLPGQAILWGLDEDLYGAYEEAVSNFCALFGKPLYKKIALVEALFGDKKDHIETRNGIYETLSIWQTILRDFIPAIGNGVQPTHLPALTREQLLDIFSAIDQAKVYIKKNVHPKLLVEHILLRIP